MVAAASRDHEGEGSGHGASLAAVRPRRRPLLLAGALLAALPLPIGHLSGAMYMSGGLIADHRAGITMATLERAAGLH